MGSADRRIELSEADLKEIFCLFASPTKYEKEQIYDKDNGHYFLDEDLSEEYSLTAEKREYAIDAWRAVMAFLRAKGFVVCLGGEIIDLAAIDEEFIE